MGYGQTAGSPERCAKIGDIMSDIETFKELVNQALGNRKKTKLHQDMEFLTELFNNTEVSVTYRAKKLADIYSVARTLNPKLDHSDLLTKDNLRLFDNWAESGKIKEDLKNFLNTTGDIDGNPVGSKEGNRIISFLSKYAYYYTEKNFPIYDSMADEHLKTLHNKIGGDSKVGGDKYEKHFNRYLTLIKHLKSNGIEKFNDHTLIDGIDAFLWLYGIMDKATKDAENEVEKKFLYSSTCGPLNGFTKWYEDSKKFMQNNKQ